MLMAHGKLASHPQQVHISIVGEKNMRISCVTDDLNASSVVEYGTSLGKYTELATGDHTTYRYFFYKSDAIHQANNRPARAEHDVLLPVRGGWRRVQPQDASDEAARGVPRGRRPRADRVDGVDVVPHRLRRAAGTDAGDYNTSTGSSRCRTRSGGCRLVQPLVSARPWMMVKEGNHEIKTLPVEFPLFVAYNARSHRRRRRHPHPAPRQVRLSCCV